MHTPGTTGSPRGRKLLARPVSLLLMMLTMLAFVPLAPAAHARTAPDAISSSSGATAAQSTVPFNPVECPIPAIEGVRVDCGYLTVAESRRDFTGKYIELAVAILRSPNPTPAPDPVIFLAGGPGQAALPLAPYVAQIFAPTLAERDVILIDQRGTGYSRPALNCSYDAMTINGKYPITGKQESERPAILQMQVDALIACGQAMRAAGIDLRAYNSVENAADLEDLRLALGYGAWNVYGGSYGTRLGLTAMRYRPDTLRSVVLESLYPLQANFHTGVFESFERSLNLLFSACAADAQCNGAYPNLGQSYDNMIARLNAEAAQVPIVDLESGELITYIPVSGIDVAALLFQLSYGTTAIPVMPLIIAETDRGNYQFLSLLFSSLLVQPTETDVAAGSLGMQVATQCNEDATFASADDFVRARDTHRRASALAHIVLFNEAILDVCAAWGLGNPDAAENQAVVSDRPTFLITGANDPITPPSYTAIAQSTLPNSFNVEYPRGGHGPSSSSPCLSVAMASFYTNPAAVPETSCIAAEAPIPFLTAGADATSLNIAQLKLDALY